MRPLELTDDSVLVHQQAVHQPAGAVEDGAHGSDE